MPNVDLDGYSNKPSFIRLAVWVFYGIWRSSTEHRKRNRRSLVASRSPIFRQSLARLYGTTAKKVECANQADFSVPRIRLHDARSSSGLLILLLSQGQGTIWLATLLTSDRCPNRIHSTELFRSPFPLHCATVQGQVQGSLK